MLSVLLLEMCDVTCDYNKQVNNKKCRSIVKHFTCSLKMKNIYIYIYILTEFLVEEKYKMLG